MTNVAMGKPVEESVTNSKVVTDGNYLTYDANSGFAWFYWPGTLTVDLGSIVQIKSIRFLLWDNLGSGSRVPANRRYRYRLLVSKDHQNWTILHDTGVDGFDGWQAFDFPECVEARFVRVHGVHNNANNEFHIVELQVHDSAPESIPKEPAFRRTIQSTATAIVESGDGKSLQSQIDTIANQMTTLAEDNPALNKTYFHELVSRMREQVADAATIDGNISAIRREIVDPVRDDLRRTEGLSKSSVFLGIIGGVLAIISILLSIFGR